jgi:hypothetical protein
MSKDDPEDGDEHAYIMLLLIDVSDLEPDVGMSEGIRRIAEDAVKALEALGVLALLLVNDAEPEEDLIGLVEV